MMCIRVLQCVTVVGGMAQQKQERLLKRGPEIVVATPGRLWELYSEVHSGFLYQFLIHDVFHNLTRHQEP